MTTAKIGPDLRLAYAGQVWLGCKQRSIWKIYNCFVSENLAYYKQCKYVKGTSQQILNLHECPVKYTLPVYSKNWLMHQ